MSAEVDFFDTNILIAASVMEHAHHAAANARLAKLATAGGACSAHTLAETYTNLTRVSGGYARPPLAAVKVLEYTQQTFTLVTLTPSEMLSAITDLATLGLPGAIVYDALLIACARKVNARFIYTFNIKHFRKIAPDLAARIIEP